MDEKSTYIVRREGEQLTGQRRGRGQTPLLAFSENGLFVENSLLHLEFKRDAKGEVTEMAMHDGDNVTVRPRIGAVPAERKVVTMPAALFDSYAGRYQLAPGFVIEFTREGEKFITQATGQGKIEMFPSGEAEFFLKVVDAQLRFKKGEDGTMGVVLSQGGREMPGKRLK
jgi:D-alanyl-D-alanine carboxypeptidase